MLDSRSSPQRLVKAGEKRRVVKIRYNPGGEEVGIVNESFARSLSVASGFEVRSFNDEAGAIAFLRSLFPDATDKESDDWLAQLAGRLLDEELFVVTRARSAPSHLHARPGELSPLEAEEAARQRDPEPVPPPPPVTPVEPMVVKPEQLKTDAPLCEL